MHVLLTHIMYLTVIYSNDVVVILKGKSGFAVV